MPRVIIGNVSLITTPEPAAPMRNSNGASAVLTGIGHALAFFHATLWANLLYITISAYLLFASHLDVFMQSFGGILVGGAACATIWHQIRQAEWKTRWKEAERERRAAKYELDQLQERMQVMHIVHRNAESKLRAQVHANAADINSVSAAVQSTNDKVERLQQASGGELPTVRIVLSPEERADIETDGPTDVQPGA